MNWLKKNWLTVLTTIVALVAGADLTSGLLQGKAILNLSNIPSLLFGSGAIGTALFRWLNNRTVVTRVAPAGLDSEDQKMLEAIFTIAASADIGDEMKIDLSNMAAALVLGHANRVKAQTLAGRVEVLPAPAGGEIGKLIEILQKAEVKS